MHKRFLLAVSLMFAMLSGSVALAHGGSHKPVSEAKAKEVAKAMVKDLVDKGKVDGSWKAKEPSMSQKAFGGEKEWVATFDNVEVKDASKKKLYVFLTLAGEVVGANHTGD